MSTNKLKFFQVEVERDGFESEFIHVLADTIENAIKSAAIAADDFPDGSLCAPVEIDLRVTEEDFMEDLFAIMEAGQ